MMETVLITGGTGLVGKALSKALQQKGYKVIILTRDVSGKQTSVHVSFAAWDVKKQWLDTTALQVADHIIHLAGAAVVEKKWTEAYKNEIRQSRTESSRLLIDSLQNNPNKVRTVVSASAIGWYGADAEPAKPFIETDTAADGFLGETCRLWEAGIEPVTKLGKRLVKLRIGIVLSNNGGALTEFKKPIRFGAAAILSHGKQVVSWIHIDDLCRMFIAGIENKNMQGSYNAVAPEPVTNSRLTIALAKALNGKLFIPIHIPAFVLKIMMGQRSVEVLKSTTVSCKKILDTGFTFQFDHIEPALKNLEKATGQH